MKLSRADVQGMFADAETRDLVGHYKKFGDITVRPALFGEVVETVIDGVVETTNSAKNVDDFVVTGAKGENYILAAATLLKRYDRIGDGVYRAKGECWAFKHEGEQFTFDAPWGEEMLVENGDIIAVADLSNMDDIYRIQKDAFAQTYRPAFVQVGDLDVIVGQHQPDHHKRAFTPN